MHKEAEKIKAKLAKSRIFGELIDLTDSDILIVASYYRGRADADISKTQTSWFDEWLK